MPVEPPAETRNGELAVPANLLASEWIAVAASCPTLTRSELPDWRSKVPAARPFKARSPPVAPGVRRANHDGSGVVLNANRPRAGRIDGTG